jgi:hypothetical protein
MVASWPSETTPAAFIAAARRSIESATARTRLARQFSPAFLARVVDRIAPQIAEAVAAALALIEHAALSAVRAQEMREALWQSALAAAVGRTRDAAWHRLAPPPASEAERALTARIAGRLRSVEILSERDAAMGLPEDASVAPLNAREEVKAAASDPAKRPREAPQDRIDLDDGVFVECAGVVLLHPFLPRLFEGLEIASGGRLRAPDRALGLLHFLATGDRRAPEYALVLAKRLCGLPLEKPCGPPHPVSDAEAEEGIGLLNAVIGHWEALGGSSIDALRGTFLVRPGKLGRRGDDDVLQVEDRAFDVLLEHLPWGMSPLQLPWMDRLLWVEWRT